MRDRLVRSFRTGFTLIELLLVIALIAVAAAVAMPRYGRAVCHYQADAAARRIVADLAAAQARAKLNSTTVTVNFDATRNRYAVPGMPDPGVAGSTSYTVALGSTPYAASLVSAAFGGASSVSFDGYGAPSSGGTIVVQSGTTTISINLNADTGTATY